ncbi:MAG: hypothetical protein R3C19_06765 [Planctomycetaceae bacterium]
MDKFEISCPGCARQLRLAESQREKQVRCPTCKTVFVVRAPQRAASAEIAAAAPQADGQQAPAKSPAADLSPQARRAAKMAMRRASAPKAGKKPKPQPKNTSEPRPARRTRAVAAEVYDDDADEIHNNPYTTNIVEDYDDPFTGADDFGYDAGLPPSAPKKRTSRSSNNTGQIVAIAVAVVVGMFAIGGLGLVAWKFLPGIGGNIVDLSYMPSDTAGFMKINVADVASSAIFRERIAGNPTFQNATAAMGQQLGLNLSDIDSVTFGISSGGMGGSMFGGLPSGSGGVMVVRTRVPVAGSLLAAQSVSGRSEETYNGEVIYSLNGRYGWLPDSRTIVIGQRSQVVAAIDGKGKQHRFRQFDFASSRYDILLVGEPGAAGSTFRTPMGSSLQRDAKGIAMGINLSGSAELNFQVNCNSRAQATASVERADRDLEDAKRNLDRQMAMSPFVNDELKNAAQRLIDDVSVTSSGSVVTLNVTIPRDVIDKVFSMIPGM